MPYFAVKKGRVPGIYTTWNDCREQIENYPNAWFKRFNTEIEADKCMKSRRSINVDNKQLKSKYQDSKEETFSPGDLEFLKLQVQIIREKIAKCIDLFSRKIHMLTKRIDMVEYDIDSVSHDPRYGLNYSANPQYIPPSSYPEYMSDPNFQDHRFKYVEPPYRKPPLQPGNKPIPPLIEDKDGFIDVYIDGSVKSNGTEYARGGIGVWFNNDHPLNIADALEGYPSTINAEIQAARRAIQQAAAAGLRKLNIHTDSTHMIYSITKWIDFWKENNWRTALGAPVKIKDEIEQLEEAVNSMEAIKWTYIRSHQGNEGNENADILAHVGVNMNGQKKFYKYRFPDELKKRQTIK